THALAPPATQATETESTPAGSRGGSSGVGSGRRDDAATGRLGRRSPAVVLDSRRTCRGGARGLVVWPNDSGTGKGLERGAGLFARVSGRPVCGPDAVAAKGFIPQGLGDSRLGRPGITGRRLRRAIPRGTIVFDAAQRLGLRTVVCGCV